MSVRSSILVAMALAALAGCSGDEHTKAEQHLMVAGPEDGVNRFAELQRSRRPTLVVSSVRPVGKGRVEAIVSLPAAFSSRELVQTTREALAAGLEYKFESRQSVLPVRS
ncbi:hypothetical protein GGQ88_003712 [Novosphingobium hassiacum]|uniref:Lipoprotein n=1 Tax=Novosphingobium hassiacum TaxID=173676 RepID=A0A7W6EXI4_9SPHN|nr:hypothetical protein [Novosphingobium hassiacum]MBB3862412.1 hypothetical protein [Novosphingobium hassiacum]